MNHAHHVLEKLTGRWSLDRDIVGERATLRGEATFEFLSDGRLAYSETGMLSLSDGRALNVYRNYIYRSEGNDVVVEFADGPGKGKVFVHLNFANGQGDFLEAHDVHYCGRDTYRVAYILKWPDEFGTDIEVTGPQKAYLAASRYRRMS
jgi:hypothetical protein